LFSRIFQNYYEIEQVAGSNVDMRDHVKVPSQITDKNQQNPEEYAAFRYLGRLRPAPIFSTPGFPRENEEFSAFGRLEASGGRAKGKFSEKFSWAFLGAVSPCR
jgi:hypothetical protein